MSFSINKWMLYGQGIEGVRVAIPFSPTRILLDIWIAGAGYPLLRDR